MDHQYYDSNAYAVYSVEINEQDENDISIEEKDGDAFLIELYRERPFLYNKGHNEFKNKIVKDNAWNKISKIMQNKNYGNFYTPEYCQTRCTSLRNQYNREKRIVNNQYKSGSAASTHKPFAFYAQLSFLDNYVRQRRTHSNIKTNETTISPASSSKQSVDIPKSNSNVDEKKDNEEKYNTDEENNNENKENILENIPHEIRKRTEERDLHVLDIKPVKHKKSKIDETKELENIFSSVTQKICSVLDNKHENNEDQAFTQFIIAHLANLAQSEKNIRKKMITDALFSPLQKM